MGKTLVTGGAGFIGSHLVAALLAQGDTVRVLDNFSTGKLENLKGLNHERIEIVEGDLRDIDAVKEAMKQVDLIFHEAAFVSPPQSILEPMTCYDVNVHGTEQLLETARHAGVRRVVLASSAAVYGDSEQVPSREQGVLQPRSPYAASKIINEIFAEMYTRVLNLEVVALRYFNVYGPKQSLETEYAAAIPVFIRQLLNGQTVTIFGDGKQTRDLIYIEDVVRANLSAATSEKAAGESINICTGQEIDMLQLLDVLQEITGLKSEIRFEAPRPGDVYRSVGRPNKANSLLGFKPKVSLHDGLHKTLAWMRT